MSHMHNKTRRCLTRKSSTAYALRKTIFLFTNRPYATFVYGGGVKLNILIIVIIFFDFAAQNYYKFSTYASMHVIFYKSPLSSASLVPPINGGHHAAKLQQKNDIRKGKEKNLCRGSSNFQDKTRKVVNFDHL